MKSEREKLEAVTTRKVYLVNSLEEMAFRSEPAPKWAGVKWFGKLPGGKEFPTEGRTKSAANAWLEWKEITAEQYEKY